MDTPDIVGLLLALALSGSFGFFKKKERGLEDTSVPVVHQNAEDFLKTVKKISPVSSENVKDFLFTVNIYKVKKNLLLGIALANAKKTTLMVDDVLIETKLKRKFLYTPLPGTGSGGKVSFQVESAKVRIFTAAFVPFLEVLNSLESEEDFFKLVVIDASGKKFKSGKLAVKKNTLCSY